MRHVLDDVTTRLESVACTTVDALGDNAVVAMLQRGDYLSTDPKVHQ